MDFDLSKPQKLLKHSAREFFARECKPERVRELMETDTAHDDKLWQSIADQGWTGLMIPEENGGLGLGLVEMAVVAEEMGRACLPGAFLSTLTAAALVERAGSVAQCPEMVGGMQWVLDRTVEYAKTRQQFGRAIGSFQAVQHQCADMLLMTESARSATYYAAWALTEDDPSASVAVSIAKAYCS